MDADELAEIKARAEAASKGPWKLYAFSPPYRIFSEQKGDRWEQDVLQGRNMLANGVFVVHARSDIPNLLAEIERLQEEHAKILGILGTILTDIDRAKAEGRPYV